MSSNEAATPPSPALRRNATFEDATLVTAAAEVAAFAAAFLILFKLASAIFTSKGFLRRLHLLPHDGLDMACKTVSAVFAVGAFSSGTFLLAFGGKPDANHPVLKHVFYATVAYFHYDLYAMWAVFLAKETHQGRPDATVISFARRKSLITAHHVVIGTVLTPLMMTRLDHDPGEMMVACALIMEGSTPFVSLRAILSYLGLKSSRLYVANGLAMVATFTTFRVLVYPAFFLVYSRQRSLTLAQTLQRLPPFCAVCLAAVLAAQLFWLSVMVKGAVKVLEERKPVNNNPEGKTLTKAKNGKEE